MENCYFYHLLFLPALRTWSLMGIFLPSSSTLLHPEGQNPPSLSRSVGLLSLLLNILVTLPGSIAGSQETPPYPPSNRSCCACTCFCVFLYFEVQRSLKNHSLYSRGRGENDSPGFPPYLNECIPGPSDNQVILSTKSSCLRYVLVFKVSGHESMKPL